jgi:tRNA ligase
LHGINLTTPEFLTLPAPQVADFAKEFGFIPTPYITFDTLDEVKRFTDSCAVDGKWNGNAIEGFVIRCRLRDATDEWQVFMWKVKFEEPYLMWREWRELTRKLLTERHKKVGKAPGETGDPPAIKVDRLKRPETRLYVEFVKLMIDEKPEMFDDWQYGRGIVKTRDAFFAWCDTEEGRQRSLKIRTKNDRAQIDNNANVQFDRTLLVPIGIPGCGMEISTLYTRKIADPRPSRSLPLQGKRS